MKWVALGICLILVIPLSVWLRHNPRQLSVAQTIMDEATIGRSYLSIGVGDSADWRKGGVLGFAYYDDGLVTALITPHWLPALLSATLAVIPWVGSIPYRFSLRTLLIATTLVAVVLGLIVIGLRWPAG